MMTVLHKEHLLAQWLAEKLMTSSPNDDTLSTRVCDLKSKSIEDVFTETRSIKSKIQRDLLGVLRALPLEVHGKLDPPNTADPKLSTLFPE